MALYGYKGANGVILVTTKRGKYNSKEVKFSYDHIYNYMVKRPQFVDAATYASAVNEARANDGLGARYTADEIGAFRDGTYPYLYPNVNWVDETYRHHGVTNKYNVEFTGGGKNFRYYTMVNLITDKGFIANPNENDGYSTQDKYTKGSMRVNLDADLTPKTKMRVNLLGVLSESSSPGANAEAASDAGNAAAGPANIWDMVYSLPSAAFPVRAESGLWGGNPTWSGTVNPVAQSVGAAYSKNHTRSIFSDITLTQDLSAILEGLGGTVRVGYDNTSNIFENHSKGYDYGSQIPGAWENGAPTIADDYRVIAESTMGTAAETNTYAARFHFDVGLNYGNTFGDHSIYTQLKYDYEYQETTGLNNTIYRQDVSWWSHYGYKNLARPRPRGLRLKPPCTGHQVVVLAHRFCSMGNVARELPQGCRVGQPAQAARFVRHNQCRLPAG